VVDKINDKVFVIGEGGSANTTLIAGKDCSIIVDTSLFPEKAMKISKFSLDIFGLPIAYVINTHYHPDHTFGNSAFENLDIIASSKTKEVMESMDFNYIKAVWGEKRAKENHITLPNVVFDDRKTFHLCDKRISLIQLGGHTPDSTIVYLEDDNILIAGDIVFNGYHPEITPDSDLDRWLQALDYIRNMQPFFVVPGHGYFGGLEVVGKMKEYILKIQMFIEEKIGENELINDPNVSKRMFPELFVSSIENILRYSKINIQ